MYGARTGQETVFAGLGEIINKGQVMKEWPGESRARTRQWATDFSGVPSEANVPTLSLLGQ